MSSSALTDRGVTQEHSGAALDVFTRQLLMDPDLITFHGGTADSVRIAQGDVDWEEVYPWSVITLSGGFETVEDRVGGFVEGLRLRAWLIWPEPSVWKNIGEVGIADLDMKARLAIAGGTNASGTLVVGNPGLQWRPNVAPHNWPAPPAGFAGDVDEQMAINGILRGPGATVHTQTEVSLQGMDSCIVNALAIDTVFGVVRSTC